MFDSHVEFASALISRSFLVTRLGTFQSELCAITITFSCGCGLRELGKKEDDGVFLATIGVKTTPFEVTFQAWLLGIDTDKCSHGMGRKVGPNPRRIAQFTVCF